KPGPHTFIAWGESDGVVHAELAPRKTYYLQFYPTMGFFSAGAGLQGVPATPENCVKVDGTLKGMAPRELIPERGATWTESHVKKQAKKLEYWEGEGRDKGGVLKPEDGRSPRIPPSPPPTPHLSFYPPS